MSKHEINHKAWAENAITFIRLNGLESDFTDWSGGWKCPVSNVSDDLMIDNAATASQNVSLLDDQVTREAIQLNIINPLRALAKAGAL